MPRKESGVVHAVSRRKAMKTLTTAAVGATALATADAIAATQKAGSAVSGSFVMTCPDVRALRKMFSDPNDKKMLQARGISDKALTTLIDLLTNGKGGDGEYNQVFTIKTTIPKK